MIPRHLLIAVVVLLVAVLALSIYALHMRRTAVPTPVASTDTRPLAPPIAGPTERVTLFVAHDDDGSLRAEAALIPLPSGRQQRAEELLRTLLSHYLDKSSPHPLGSGADIRSVFLVDPGRRHRRELRLCRYPPLRRPGRGFDRRIHDPYHLDQHARHFESQDPRRRPGARHPRRPRRSFLVLRRNRSESTRRRTTARTIETVDVRPQTSDLRLRLRPSDLSRGLQSKSSLKSRG